MPELIVYLRNRELIRKPILMSEVKIGRDAHCDIVLDNAGVSRTHAEIVCNRGQFIVRDAGSENGFTVNGEKTNEATLKHGDIVGINKFKVYFDEAGGVPVEMLESPKRAIAGGPANVVATMTVNADAAKQLQQQIIAKKAAEARQAQSGPRRLPLTLIALAVGGAAALYFLFVF